MNDQNVVKKLIKLELNEQGKQFLKKFGLKEEDLKKPRVFGKPWKDHSITMKDAENKFSCAFCLKQAITKTWLGGYTGVLVCKVHLELLKIQNLFLFSDLILEPIE